MSKGIFLFAQNTEDTNYVEQACYCAITIKTHNPNLQIAIATNDFVPLKYKKFFDHIIEITGTDLSANENWKISNRSKIYNLTPFDETVVLDTDVLVCEDLEKYFPSLSSYDLYFTTNPVTYRGETITERYYRKTFVKNSLPDTYVGMHYFKKSDLAKEFYNWLDIIVQNWQDFYKQHLEYNRPDFCSIDVCSAIAIKIMEFEAQVTGKSTSLPKFVHMKPKVQNWYRSVNSWQDYVACYLTDDCKLKVGNYNQSGIFHYTEDTFVKNYLQTRIKDIVNG